MTNAKTVWVMVVVLSLAGSTVLALVEFKDGQTYNINYEINDSVWLDYLAPGMQTTLNLLDDGSIEYWLIGYENGQINLLGGEIGWDVFTYDRSQVHMSGGSIQQELAAHDESVVEITGGSIGWSAAYDNSQVSISGGSIAAEFTAYGSSHVTISGGSMASELGTRDNSHVDIFGGFVGLSLQAYYGGTLTIHGSDFVIDGQPFGYGELTSILGGNYWDDPTRHLTGTLASGEPIDNDFYIGDDAKIVLVPEAGSIETTVDIDPDTFNLKSKVPWITCYIELPEGYNVGDIDVSTVMLNGQIQAESHPTEIGDYDNDSVPDLMVKFDRSAVQEILEVGDEVEITVAGELNVETFEGSDTIRVIDKGGKK